MSLPEEILTQIAFAAARSDPQSVFTLSQTSDAFRKLLLSETVLRDLPTEKVLRHVTLERWEKGGKLYVDRLADAGNVGALHFRGVIRVNCSDEGDDAAVIAGLKDIGRSAAQRHPPAVFSLLKTVQFLASDRWTGPVGVALREALVLGRPHADTIASPDASAAARVSPANSVLVQWNAANVCRVQRWKRMGGPGVVLRLPYLNHCSMEDCGRRCVKGSGFVAQLNFCAECRIQPYCSKSCQTAHWALGHRRQCRKLQVVAMAAHAHAHAVLAAHLLNGDAPGQQPGDPADAAAPAHGATIQAGAGGIHDLLNTAGPFYIHGADEANVSAAAAAAAAAASAATDALAVVNGAPAAPGLQQLRVQINNLVQGAFDMVGAAAAGDNAAALAQEPNAAAVRP